MIRNISLTLGDTADSFTKILAVQQKPLDSHTKLVYDNRIALDYLLAEQGGVCAALYLPYLD